MQKRYCICTFWEKNGIVRDYFSYYIKSLADICEKVVVVVNGGITDEGRKNLLSIKNTEILQRENFGIDFGAYKAGIENIGYEKLNDYDELLLTNCSCYGPIYPLEDMFKKMEAKDCDFWGITKYTKYRLHIQSYFICINKKMFSSSEFKSYWDDLTLYDNYLDGISEHETKFTEHFENFGFKSDCFIDVDYIKHMGKNCCDPMFYSEMLIEKFKLPLVKRKSIVQENYYSCVRFRFNSSLSNSLIKYLNKNTNYDVNMIYQDILAIHPMSVIQDFFQMYYVLPSEHKTTINTVKNQKIALILYIYYEDLIDYCLKYAKSMPEGTDIYIVSSKQNVIDLSKEKTKSINEYHFIFRLKENRGRDVSAYLVTCRDVFENYDLICCMHDKKTPTSVEGLIYGINFQHHCFENNLATKEYVSNIISMFNDNKYLGLICPPPTYIVFHDKLRRNLEHLKNLYEILNLKIPFDKNPNAPFGSMFWVRKEAIAPLFRKSWTYEDFPDEPLPPNRTISHAIERIYPMIAQEAGFFSAVVMPDFYASNLITNSLYYNKQDKYQIIKENIQLFNNLKGLKKIFSIKNAYINNQKYKQICILGIKILKPVFYNNSFLENIISVKNDTNKKHKVITVLGFKLKCKNHIKKLSKKGTAVSSCN